MRGCRLAMAYAVLPNITRKELPFTPFISLKNYLDKVSHHTASVCKSAAAGSGAGRGRNATPMFNILTVVKHLKCSRRSARNIAGLDQGSPAAEFAEQVCDIREVLSEYFAQEKENATDSDIFNSVSHDVLKYCRRSAQSAAAGSGPGLGHRRVEFTGQERDT